MYGDNVTFAQATVVCLFSLAVVFLVLLSISYIIDLVAWLIRRGEKKSKAPKAGTPVRETVYEPVSAPVNNSVDTVLVAATIAAYLGKRSDEFVVRSIRRVGRVESAWTQKSRMDSVQ